MGRESSTTGNGARTASEHFLLESNLCGRTLLRLVLRGHVILTDFLVQSEDVPEPVRLAADQAKEANSRTAESSSSLFTRYLTTSSKRSSGSDNNDPSKSSLNMEDEEYIRLLLDFDYIRNPDAYDGGDKTSISQDEQQIVLKFKQKYGSSIEKIYKLLNSIRQYQTDLHSFAMNLSMGLYAQYTVDSILLDDVGRQLLCDALYLYGMMLIYTERYFPGPIRERIIVAYYRFCCTVPENRSLKSDMTHLFQSNSSGDTSTTNIGTNDHTDNLFSRTSLHPELIRNIVGSLISADVYATTTTHLFPHFDHRTTRFARQASVLYVCLLFRPSILQFEHAVMTEIVHRFFSDTWILPLYAAMTVDLSVQWKPFDAARRALERRTITLSNIKTLHMENAILMERCHADMERFMGLGRSLSDDFVLASSNQLLECMRRCNVALRWRMMHRIVEDFQQARLISDDRQTQYEEKDENHNVYETDIPVRAADLVSFLLTVSEFEMKVKNKFHDLVGNKNQSFLQCQTKATELMTQLCDYYSGGQALGRVQRNEGLLQWFHAMAKEIQSLSHHDDDQEHFTLTARKIHHSIQALEDMEQLEIIESNLQVKAHISECKVLLRKMLRLLTLSPTILRTINDISNIGYCRETIGTYVPIIFENLQKDPSTVRLLRCLFFKLTTLLHDPTLRFVLDSAHHHHSSDSSDLQKVKDFFSSWIEKFVRNVLGIVPVSVLSLLIEIFELQDRKSGHLPSKISIDHIGDFLQPNEQHRISYLSYQISLFTEGILTMESMQIGDTIINSTHLFEVGLREEFARRINLALHQCSPRHDKNEPVTSTSILKWHAASIRSFFLLSRHMTAFRCALEYLQNFIGFNGSVVWTEEIRKVVDNCLEQEAKKSVLSNSRTDKDQGGETFLGRTLTALLKMTEPKVTIYSPDRSCWLVSNGTEILGLRLLSLLCRAIGTNGLMKLDRLLSFRVTIELNRFFKFYRTTAKNHGILLEQTRDGLFPEWRIPDNGMALCGDALKKLDRSMEPIMACLRRIGQAQLLRRLLRNEVQIVSSIQAPKIKNATNTLNTALMAEEVSTITAAYSNGSLESIPDSVQQIANRHNDFGFGEPMAEIFVSTEPQEGLPLFLSLFVLYFSPKFKFDEELGALVRTKDEYSIDGWPAVAGIATLLKQFHPTHFQSVMEYLSQSVRSAVKVHFQKKSRRDDPHRLPPEVKNTMIFMKQLCTASGTHASTMHRFLPQYVLELCAGF